MSALRANTERAESAHVREREGAAVSARAVEAKFAALQAQLAEERQAAAEANASLRAETEAVTASRDERAAQLGASKAECAEQAQGAKDAMDEARRARTHARTCVCFLGVAAVRKAAARV